MTTSLEEKEVTVKSIRRELRNMLFQTLFYGVSVGEVNEDKSQVELAKQLVYNFSAFGVNTGLITKEEFTAWNTVDNSSKENCLAKVVLKYKDEDEG